MEIIDLDEPQGALGAIPVGRELSGLLYESIIQIQEVRQIDLSALFAEAHIFLLNASASSQGKEGTSRWTDTTVNILFIVRSVKEKQHPTEVYQLG